jgi:hypothetical protein
MVVIVCSVVFIWGGGGMVYGIVNFSLNCVYIYNWYDVDRYGVALCSSNFLPVLYVFMK